eukprot:g6157.t1
MCLIWRSTRPKTTEKRRLMEISALLHDNEVPLNAAYSTNTAQFSVLAKVAVAVKKFQASLNPTVSFRKRNLPEDVLADKRRAVSDGYFKSSSRSLRRTYTRTASGRVVPRSTHEYRGHMTSYLLRPLS